jgi:hypothetical protein
MRRTLGRQNGQIKSWDCSRWRHVRSPPGEDRDRCLCFKQLHTSIDAYKYFNVASSLSTWLTIGWEMLSTPLPWCCELTSYFCRPRIGLVYPRVAFVTMESITWSLLQLWHMIPAETGLRQVTAQPAGLTHVGHRQSLCSDEVSEPGQRWGRHQLIVRSQYSRRTEKARPMSHIDSLCPC